MGRAGAASKTNGDRGDGARASRAGKATHSLLAGPGWWERARRDRCWADADSVRRLGGPPVLITGATGTLSRACARLCAVRGNPYLLLRRQELDIGTLTSIRAAFDHWSPWAVINTARYVRIDDAEHDARQWQDNALGPANLAQVCAERDANLVTFCRIWCSTGGAQLQGPMWSRTGRLRRTPTAAPSIMPSRPSWPPARAAS
ncbi:MAG: sugar nucleotide-binding protein [Betaproteobacteria bacterium]